ncbi:MAG: acyltransferase [bacterium]|nr:acyltransferase [bacterium]
MTTTTKKRDIYVDFLRAFSLVIVVIWHWVFTILELTPETVSPSNPIGFTRGMWAITWVLQVMPVFFFVGGFTHRLAFDNYEKGTSRRFLKRRSKRLLVPALSLVAIWIGLGFIIDATLDAAWAWPAVILVLSPLWFLVVYLLLVAIAPLAIRAHWRWGELVLVWLVGMAAVLDVLRFHHLQGWAAWLNFIIIWGLAHQLGFFYDRLVAAPRRVAWMLTWSGLFALIALTNMGFYPRSVVGVPGERFSNMGPPTLAIVALTFLQIGLVLLVRDWVQHRLDTSPGWQSMFGWVNTSSLPLYLLHTTGMAITIALLFVMFDYLPPSDPTIEWWISRPLWFLGPALATYPFLVLFAKISGPGHEPVGADELAT